MKGYRKKSPRQKDMTSRYADDDVDEDRVERSQRFSSRNKNLQADKTARTSEMRANFDQLPLGQVVQVYSLFCQVEHTGNIWLCTVRKTLGKITKGDIIVGDEVRFLDGGTKDESGRPEGVIEQILPRRTVLTRSDSFKQLESHPIVANAEQVLIVASIREPNIKWGLIDRMLIAAQSGGLTPILCINKIDVADDEEHLRHYESVGIRTLRTSVTQSIGLELLKQTLHDKTTVIAGHSGVGKSSLIRTIQPNLDLRIGPLSGYSGKGMHTTTSAVRYPLDFGGHVIDTPGVKMFGLWGVTSENLDEYFPDVVDGSAPSWRKESYERISSSI